MGQWVSAVQPAVLQEVQLIRCLRVQEDVGPGTWLLRRRVPATGVDNLMNEECSLPGTPFSWMHDPRSSPTRRRLTGFPGCPHESLDPPPKNIALARTLLHLQIYTRYSTLEKGVSMGAFIYCNFCTSRSRS